MSGPIGVRHAIQEIPGITAGAPSGWSQVGERPRLMQE
jgi:hypothetical protein